MSKAVLIMDMPECCADCQLADDDPSGLYCVPADKYYDGEESTEDRASWCPLRELPEKEETTYPQACYENSYWTDEMKAGFNACLNEIMRQGMSDSVD